MKLRILLAIGMSLAASAALSASQWAGSWGASPLPTSGGFGGGPASYNDQTVRQVVRLSVGGDEIRIRLSNEYGTTPLTVGAASVALASADGTVKAGTRKTVSFGGKTQAMIPPGAPYLSDPIDLEVDDLASLSISLYFPGDTGPCTCHQVGAQTGYVVSGNHTGDDFTADSTIQFRAFLSGVDVFTDDARGVVVALGDSITDGVGATADTSTRWPDVLAERLAARRGDGFGVVNEGISGNRVLADGAGVSALTRFDRDVLSVPGVTHVIVFEGVNDLGIGFGASRFGGPGRGGPAAGGRGGPGAGSTGGRGGPGAGGPGGRGGPGGPVGGALALPPSIPVSADSLIAGYRQLIARAHAAGLKIYGATITPYEGASYYSEEGEAAREQINTWIRESGEVDGVVDFDAAIRDPANPKTIKDGLHAGDHLHGSVEGYKKMGGAIDLALF
jgi:lysophospholipase L1-like esterase